MNPHRCLGLLRPCTINVAKLRVLIRNAASIGTFDLIFIVKQGQIYAFLRKFRMDVYAIRFHVHLCFVKPLRIKRLIKPLVSESLLERPADAFLISQLFDIPDSVPGAVDRIGDLCDVVSETSESQNFGNRQTVRLLA